MLIGWLVSLLILAPNLLWLRFPPVSMPPANTNAKSWSAKALEAIETIGRVGVFVMPFFYCLGLSGVVEKFSAGLMLAALAVYYGGWLRYFRGGRAYALLYRPLFGIPVPLAISPTIYFAAAAIALHSSLLAVATVLFGIAHISLSWQEAKRVEAWHSKKLEAENV